MKKLIYGPKHRLVVTVSRLLLMPYPKSPNLRLQRFNVYDGLYSRNKKISQVLVTDADLLTWLPGDVVYDDQVFLPYDMPNGNYDLEIAIVSPHTLEPAVKLAISGVNEEGWYPMGQIMVNR